MPADDKNPPLHPQLAERLAELGLSRANPPDQNQWSALLARLSACLQQSEQLHSELWSRLADAPAEASSGRAELAQYAHGLERQTAQDAKELQRLYRMLAELETQQPQDCSPRAVA